MKSVACIGRTNVPKDSEEFLLMRRVAYWLVSQQLGIIHGGYKGGMMEAFAQGASEAIREHNLLQEYNRGVPYDAFDDVHALTEQTQFITPASNLGSRLHAILDDAVAVVVAPCGSMGTFTELIYILHVNQLRKHTDRCRTPIFLFGNQWMPLLDSVKNDLELTEEFLDAVHVVSSLEQFTATFKKQEEI